MSLPTNQRQNVERAMMGAGTFAAPPATIYAAAFIGGTEQTANGWARVAVVRATVFPDADPLVSAEDITFPIVSVATNGIDSIRFYDASSGGNLIWPSDTFAAVNVEANGFLRVPAGVVTVAVT